VSRDITLSENGMPAGLTFDAFRHVIRTGEDPDNPGQLLQVMPWPVYQSMTDRDLRAIYEYLSAIPAITSERLRPSKRIAARPRRSVRRDRLIAGFAAGCIRVPAVSLF
jgi:hypothetical protein